MGRLRAEDTGRARKFHTAKLYPDFRIEEGIFLDPRPESPRLENGPYML
jgi:hypothetical protein